LTYTYLKKAGKRKEKKEKAGHSKSGLTIETGKNIRIGP
jgi:hypothetical protein